MDTDVANQAVAESHDNKQSTNHKLIILWRHIEDGLKFGNAKNQIDPIFISLILMLLKLASFLLFHQLFETVVLRGAFFII